MKKKQIATLLSFVIVAAISIGATFAYLTDAESAKNTFTVGKVNISLDEKDVDDSTSNADRDKANQYHLIPGHSYTKDPTVTVLANSEDSYVRMLVTVENMNELKAALPKAENPDYYGEGDVFLLQKLVEGWDGTTWVFKSFDADTSTYEFRYKEAVKKSNADQKLDALFDKIVVPGELDNEDLAHWKNVEINVTAQAVQAVGFNSADEAWNAFSK